MRTKAPGGEFLEFDHMELVENVTKLVLKKFEPKIRAYVGKALSGTVKEKCEKPKQAEFFPRNKFIHSIDKVPDQFVPEVCKHSLKARKAVDEWLEYRAAAKKPMTLLMFKMNFRKLSKLSKGEFIDAIHNAIARGWTGLYPHFGDSKMERGVALGKAEELTKDGRALLEGISKVETPDKEHTALINTAALEIRGFYDRASEKTTPPWLRYFYPTAKSFIKHCGEWCAAKSKERYAEDAVFVKNMLPSRSGWMWVVFLSNLKQHMKWKD